jgi:hypothetical protein
MPALAAWLNGQSGSVDMCFLLWLIALDKKGLIQIPAGYRFAYGTAHSVTRTTRKIGAFDLLELQKTRGVKKSRRPGPNEWRQIIDGQRTRGRS